MLLTRSTLSCLLLASLALASCAKDRGAATSAGEISKAEAYLTPAKDLEHAISIAKTATVRCAEGATCSPSIGLLSFALETNAAQCTATLVAPDIVATNAHCVPDELQKAGASCQGRIWMNFAKNDNAAFETQIDCAEVLIAEGAKGEDVADYAFLRLSKASARPFLRVSRRGIKDGEQIRVEKVDPVKGEGATGIQHEVTCVAVQHTILADFNSDRDPVPLLADCEARGGNSGSALRASDGTVLGVLYSVLDTKNLPQAFADKGMTVPGPFGPLNLGSNYACLKLPEALNAGAPDAACAGPAAPNRSADALNDLTNKQLNVYVQANFAAHEGFRWFDFEPTRPTEREIVLKAKCVEPTAKMNQEALVGDLKFLNLAKLDAYSRLTEFTLDKAPSEPVKALIKPTASGKYIARIGAEKMLLPKCPKQ